MSAERYTLDANILVYAMDPTTGDKNRIALQLWKFARCNDCVLTVQTIAETYNAVTKKLPVRKQEASRVLDDLLRNVPIVGSVPVDVSAAMEEHMHRPVHFWDAMLWATARRNGCSTILTENLPDREVVGGVRYLNPFQASPDDLARFLEV